MSNFNLGKHSPISIAKSVRSVANLTNEYAYAIMDRSVILDEDFVNEVLNCSIFGWEGRSPRPALDRNGNFKGTDLDMLSFLVPVVKRGAVIEIPRYENRRRKVSKVNERKVGDIRFGNATGLISNKDVFSFSVRIFDRAIVKKNFTDGSEIVGADRNYMIVNCNGHLYNGMNRIVFDLSAKENAFLLENGLLTEDAVYFKNCVHPNRRQSIYGAPYLLLKMLSLRLADEARFYRKEVERLEALGIVLPENEKTHSAPILYEGDSKIIRVESLEAELVLPGFKGRYKKVSNTQAGLVKAHQRQKHLACTLRPMAQFVVRADELAFYHFGYSTGFIAHWMAGSSWHSVFDGNEKWNEMILSNDVALRYRIRSVLQEVSAK